MSAPACSAPHDLRRRQRTGNRRDARLFRRFHNPVIETRARDEQSARSQTLTRHCLIEHRARPDDRIGMTLTQAGNNLKCARHCHCDLHDRYTSADHRLGGEVRVLRGSDANGRKYSDFPYLEANLFSGHESISSKQKEYRAGGG